MDLSNKMNRRGERPSEAVRAKVHKFCDLQEEEEDDAGDGEEM